uniref:Sushi domain-containing protein n=1 Tax=Cyprinus carpio carpio TaxID=630221 RepID=A0A8C1BJE7_CYPCA
MRVPVKLLGFGFWLFSFNFAQCQECLRENIKYADIVPVEKASYADGETVKVNCVAGYTGLYKLKCEKGEWKKSIERPCAKKKCGHPGDTQNGDFKLTEGTEFVFGATVVYTCKKGYEMASRINQRTCRIQGWDNAVPVCEVVKCPAISTDGEVTASGNTEEGRYGDVIHFECVSSDKMIDGSSDIHCEETGKWSDVVPNCKDITCIAPVIPNGYVVQPQPEYQKDATLRYKCNETFKPREGIPRCAKFGWTLKPECDEVTCELKSTTFGVKKIKPHGKTIFRVGESVEITCSEKHWFFGSKEDSRSFTCKDNGVWDYEPVCAEITCETPYDQNVYRPYYYFIGDKKLGAITSYRCESGYRQTAAKATCTRDGWTPKPLCAEIVCAAPNIPNAEIDGGQRENYKINSRIQYKCRSGFEPEEPVQITCDSQGQWTGIQQCTKMCAAPNIPNAEIQRGHQRPNYRINSRIQYKCHPGFEPEQPFHITCDSQAQWTGIQQCTKMPKLCLELFLENGFIYSHPSNKEEIFYSCKTGYKPFTGNWWDSVTCRKGSQFDEPRCIREEECGALPSVHHGKLTLTLHDPETADVECDPGYMSTDRSIKCTNGRWKKPVCKEVVRCGIPPNVENAVITSKPEEFYPDGSNLTYVCRSLYLISGESTVSCRNGTWEKTPTCQETKCNANLSENMRSDEHWGSEVSVRPGQTITLSCVGKGYTLQGQREITCQSNGEWSSAIPKCEETKCNANLSENMRSDEHWGSEVSVRPGQTITLSCVGRGYTLQGQEKITCQSNGEWSSAIPKCEETKCNANLSENMRSDEHRGSEVSVRPGETITLSCVGRGYTLQGQEKITCQPHGEWSSPFPKCEGQTTSCGPPPDVNDADTIELKKDEYNTGERVVYGCFNKYILDLSPSFSRYLTCEQGEWRGNIKCLKPCTVTVEEMNRRGIDLAYADRQKMFAPHNDYITFACQWGKVLEGDRQLRQQCDDGVMTLPECVGRWE